MCFSFLPSYSIYTQRYIQVNARGSKHKGSAGLHFALNGEDGMKMNIGKSIKEILKDESGFTLIEMVVVLLIISILAASSLPSMMKYVDEAKKTGYMTKTRSIYVASQMVLTQAYAAGGDSAVKAIKTGDNLNMSAKTSGGQTVGERIAELCDMSSSEIDSKSLTVTLTGSQVDGVVFIQGGYKSTLLSGSEGSIIVERNSD